MLVFDESGYIEDAGIELGDAFSLEGSDNQAVAALDPEDLTSHWKRLDLHDCNALLLSACGRMPSLSTIGTVERHSGLDAVRRSGNDAGNTARARARAQWCRAPGVLLGSGLERVA